MDLSSERLERFWTMVKIGSDAECWPWTGALTRGGYGQVCVGGPGAPRRNRSAHRIAWEASRGPIPDGVWILHHCDIPCCCNPAHMFHGDVKRNSQDMRERLRSLRGTRNSNVKLTEAAVMQIRALRGLMSASRIANRFGITKAAVSKIQLGRTWKHLSPRPPTIDAGISG
jgi:hypothetical protein